MSYSGPGTVADLLRYRSTRTPDDVAYIFLDDGERDERRITYGHLDAYATRIAAALTAEGAQGERALLLFPPGIDYIAAFLGCLYAGTVAVPAYPPQSARGLQRVAAVVADSGAMFALTVESLLPMGQAALDAPVRWLATDAVPEIAPDTAKGPDAESARVDPDTLAFLQYTSGSTRAPRGVMLTHANLISNLATIHSCFSGRSPFAGPATDVVVSWLPPYHDMGLIGAILQPLYGGYPAVLMSPLHFLQRPARWLEAISRYSATISPAPNFAYELCLRKVDAEQRRQLDLSSWRVAINGAEPVRPETIERFTSVFAESGLPETALRPCYGLAEATLLVTSDDVGVPVNLPEVDGVRRVSCGPVRGDQELLVVDPVALAPVKPGVWGEIWLSGPSIAAGYWGRPTETAALFQARLAGRQYLRTGDLGQLDDAGGLIVGGRIKDLIIVRGRNVYPQDVEQAVEESHRALRPGCSAAFGVPVDGEERLVVVAEVTDGADLDEVAAAARPAVWEASAAELHELVLIAARTVPKTSSGKIQRHAARAAYLSGDLDPVGRWPAADRAPAAFVAPRTQVEAVIAAIWADLLGVERVGVHEDFLAAGGQSLQLAQLATRIEAELPVRVTIGDIFEAPTVAKLAGLLSNRPLFAEDRVQDLISEYESG